MRALKALGLMRWAEPLFQATSLEAQQALLETQRIGVDRGLVWWKLFCHPLVIYTLAQDPSFLRSTDGSVGAYLVRRLIDYASSNLLRDSYFLRLAYDCGLTPRSPLPALPDTLRLRAGAEESRSPRDPVRGSAGLRRTAPSDDPGEVVPVRRELLDAGGAVPRPAQAGCRMRPARLAVLLPQLRCAARAAARSREQRPAGCARSASG